MTGLNLYKNYNLSLSDIHRQRYVAAQNTEPVAHNTSTNKKKVIIGAAVGAIAISLIATVIFTLFMKETPPPPTPVRVVETPIQVTPTADSPAIKPVDYVQIQILDFEDAVDDTQEAMDGALSITKDKGSATTPTPQEPANQQPATPAPAVSNNSAPVTPVANTTRPTTAPSRARPANVAPLYAINVAKLNQGEYQRLSDMARAAGLKINATNNGGATVSWAVYLPSAYGDTVVNGVNAVLQQTFADRAVAVDFAYSLGVNDVIVMQQNINNADYELNICCTSLDKATTFAQNSGMTDKLFQIKREN